MASDFVDGLIEAVALVFLITVGLITHERSLINSLILILFALIWCGQEVLELIVIVVKCDYVLSPTLANIGWATLDDFFNDPWMNYGRYGVLASACAMTIVYSILERRRNGGDPAPDSE